MRDLKYNCLSVNIKCFYNESYINQFTFYDRFKLISQLPQIKEHFPLNTIDIGPFETFHNFDLIYLISDLLDKNGFKSRLLTSGKYFTDLENTTNWFKQLQRVGTSMILLRLNAENIRYLPYDNVKNYLVALSSIGQRPYIRFDLTDQIPEEVYQLLRNTENDIFYNDLFFFKKRKLDVYKQSDYSLDRMHPQEFRVIVSHTGEVRLRKHIKDETVEIIIGNLNDNNLGDIINPYDLFVMKEKLR